MAVLVARVFQVVARISSFGKDRMKSQDRRRALQHLLIASGSCLAMVASAAVLALPSLAEPAKTQAAAKSAPIALAAAIPRPPQKPGRKAPAPSSIAELIG